MKNFVLSINAANGILTDAIANVEIVYTTQNTIEVQEGDMIIGCIGQPIGQVRMLFQATQNSDGNKIYLKKLLDISEGVDFAAIPELQSVIDACESGGKDVEIISDVLLNQTRKLLINKLALLEDHSMVSLKEEFRRYILFELGLVSTRQVRDLEMISEMALEEGAISKLVYTVDNVDEFLDMANKIKNSEKYKEYKAKRKDKNGESGLACDQGMTNYEKFLRFLHADNQDKYMPINPATGVKSSYPRNRIFFGAPGTGKSFTVNSEKDKLLGANSKSDFERVTFHPDYSYANFVGTYKPVPCKDSDGKDAITYEYVPGPFMRMLVKALKSARLGEKRPFLLVIEEINRANVAAVFGDIFQLLDRGSDNVSEYSIQTSEDMRKYFAKHDVLGGSPDMYETLVLPDNLFIWATMNSADQGVFPMDTAFKRRWDFTYIGIDDNDSDLHGKMVEVGTHVAQRVEWNKLRKAINNFLAKKKINEDKQLGPYFITRDIVVPSGTDIDKKRFADVFKSKVIMYLFEDAAKQRRSDLFEGCFQKSNRYSEICKEFDEHGIGIFHHDIILEADPEDVAGPLAGTTTE